MLTGWSNGFGCLHRTQLEGGVRVMAGEELRVSRAKMSTKVAHLDSLNCSECRRLGLKIMPAAWGCLQRWRVLNANVRIRPGAWPGCKSRGSTPGGPGRAQTSSRRWWRPERQLIKCNASGLRRRPDTAPTQPNASGLRRRPDITATQPNESGLRRRSKL